MTDESSWISLFTDPDALILLTAYFSPTLLAVARRSAFAGTCFFVNLFFGWTFIGWIIAVGMASSPTKKQLAYRAKVQKAKDDFFLREAETAHLRDIKSDSNYLDA